MKSTDAHLFPPLAERASPVCDETPLAITDSAPTGLDAPITAFALCWPNDPNYLLFVTSGAAEENKKWFSKNYRTDRDGRPRGEPFIVELMALARSGSGEVNL